MTISIESLLAARLFLSPQLLGNRLFFLSNLGQGGHLSLYAMDAGGSFPEPLLPARIAMPNPELAEAEVFVLYPNLGKILLMLDHDGDENYQPMLIPLEGGIPEPAFGTAFDGYRVRCLESDPQRNLAYLNAESRTEQMHVSFQANLETGELLKLGQHAWGSFVDGVNANHTRVIMKDSSTLTVSPATPPSQIFSKSISKWRSKLRRISMTKRRSAQSFRKIAQGLSDNPKRAHPHSGFGGEFKN